MVELRETLDRLSLRHDGVDGKDIYLYGEGWNFGEVADDARFVQATQLKMAGTGIGTFNDRLRDAVRGGGPFDDNPRVQGFASGLYTDPNGDPVNGTPDEQKARLLLNQDRIKVGPDRQPEGLPLRRPHRSAGERARRSTTTASRPATPPTRRRRSPTSRRTTTRRCTTPWPTSCPSRRRWPTGSGCRPWRWRPRRSARECRSGTPAGRCCAASRWTATATTPATGSTCSTTATRPTASAVGCRHDPTTRPSGTTCGPCWPTPPSTPTPGRSSAPGGRRRSCSRSGAAARCSAWAARGWCSRR